jgi:hypothetical protein
MVLLTTLAGNHNKFSRTTVVSFTRLSVTTLFAVRSLKVHAQHIAKRAFSSASCRLVSLSESSIELVVLKVYTTGNLVSYTGVSCLLCGCILLKE